MQFKKSKTFLAAVLAAAMTCSAVLPTAASAAAGTRTKDEAYGDKSYAQRFMSLYDDVVTNGVQNGYMSSTNTVSDGLGIPYHLEDHGSNHDPGSAGWQLHAEGQSAERYLQR